jgi:hypothetical protein
MNPDIWYNMNEQQGHYANVYITCSVYSHRMTTAADAYSI